MPIADAASPPIHALKTSAIAERSSANVQERVYGSGKNLRKTLTTRLISWMPKGPGVVVIHCTGKDGEGVIRSMWSETACSKKIAGVVATIALQRWMR